MLQKAHIPYKLPKQEALPHGKQQGTEAPHSALRFLKVPKTKLPSDIKLQDQSFFAGSPYYHPELGVPHTGMLGDPVPYSVSNDNMLIGMLLGCFVLAMIALSKSLNFIIRQAKHFFYMPRRAANVTETSYEVHFQSFLVLQTALLLSMIFCMLKPYTIDGMTTGNAQLIATGVLTGIITLYFLLKNILYRVVNWTFFDRKKNKQWIKTWLFLTALEGVVLFPITLLQVFYSFPLSTVLIATGIVVGLVKILVFYKEWSIFFKGRTAFLQNILYFCALEAMPLLALLGILNIAGNYLKVIF
ncbi:MAG: DUF4271 domain-containing protein [Prevotella sp.]|nr:DUF4271 domain-containing protein [Prevotella sp.]